MAPIERVEILRSTSPKVRTDAIQSFVTQETPIVDHVRDGAQGTVGSSIGTGGSSVVVLATTWPR